jgi:hypothetical protein
MKIKLIILSLMVAFNSYAAKFAGGDLTYKNIGGNNYEITFSGYFDCSGGNPPNNQPIFFECSSNPSLNFDTVLALITSSISQTFPSTCNTVCNGGSEFGIQEFIYKINIQIPSCSDWLVSCTGGSRTNITTMAGIFNWYLYFKLNNSTVQSSSPSFNNSPIILSCLNTMSCYNPQIIDNTGDSLVLDLVCPMSGKNQTIILAIPYSCSNVILSNPPFTFNYITGEICFSPTSVITSFTCLKIEKWRKINGQPTLLGVIHRDLYFKIYSCSNNQPQLSGMDFTNSGTYSSIDTIFHKEIYAGELCEFSINGFDADTFNANATGSPEMFFIEFDTTISQAIFTNIADSTDHASLKFSWTPNLTDISQNPKSFLAIIKDLYCPVQGASQAHFFLKVLPPKLNLGNDTSICKNHKIWLQADSGAFQYVWSTGDTTVSILLDSNNLNPGLNYITIVRIGYGYTDYDTIIVTMNICAGISESADKQTYSIVVSPNPTSENILIEFDRTINQIIEIKIYNPLGAKVLSKRAFCQKSVALDVSKLRSGIYFIRVSDESGKVYSDKLLIE